MARPKRVRFDKFHLYDKLHTTKEKMLSGVEITALFPIKETKHFYQSIEVWAYCASKFRAKKPFNLSVTIPEITDEKTIAFLEKEAWHDWIAKGGSDITESVALFAKLFPNKKPMYFYELDSIISAYIQGNFTENESEDLAQRKQLTHKYTYGLQSEIEEVKSAYIAYRDEKDKEKQTELFRTYYDKERNYAYQNNCLDNEFKIIGENTVCYPVAFSDDTADWYMKKYGKPCSYGNAGEIFFVTTKDTIYFDIKRHY